MEISFPGTRQDESVKLILLKHWIVKLKVVMELAFLIIFPIIAVFVYAFIKAPYFTTNYQKIFLIFFIIYLLFVSLINFIHWLNEELDVFIVTTERIVSIDQIKFMHRTISETPLYQVQDVRSDTKGVLGTLLDYGDIEIQTAADQIFFRIESVPDAFSNVGRILDLKEKHAVRMKVRQHQAEQKIENDASTVEKQPDGHLHVQETHDKEIFNVLTGEDIEEKTIIDTDATPETISPHAETFSISHPDEKDSSSHGPNPIDLSNP